MSLRNFRFVPVAAFLFGCTRSTPLSVVPERVGYAAVTRDSVVLVFPPVPSGSFVLNIDQPATTVNDYYWSVVIPHTPRFQSVWFMIDGVRDGHRIVVPIEVFVTRARLGAFRGTGSGPYVDVLDSIPLSLIGIGGRLAIVVHGRAAVRRLFDQRPTFVTFVRHTRNQPSATDSVAVAYR